MGNFRNGRNSGIRYTRRSSVEICVRDRYTTRRIIIIMRHTSFCIYLTEYIENRLDLKRINSVQLCARMYVVWNMMESFIYSLLFFIYFFIINHFPFLCIDHSRSLSLRCSAMEGTVGTVGKWKRERRHRAVCSTSPVSSPTPPPQWV